MTLRVLTRVALVAGLWWSTSARADLFSPGELTKAHQTIEGISNCTKCHPAGGQLSQQQCLSCHTELGPRIQAGKGLHGRITTDKRNCEACHHEHQGRAAAIVDWGQGGKKGFDHKRTGWALKGEHLKADCVKCHEKRLITWPVAVKLLEARPATFLGVDQACESCHFDEHRGQQKEDCEYCHNEVKWKPAPGFDHDTTDYPLKGKHAKVKCEKCHAAVKDEVKHGFPAPKNETYLKFGGLEFANCTDCHKDPHENRFGQRCTSCHTVDGWGIIRNASKEREFHEKTRFPLKGAHLDTECAACHGPYPGQPAKFKGLKYEACTDCHADAHAGQLGASGKLPDCTTCHTVDAFLPAKYSLTEHGKTSFALEGAHMAVPCDDCHEATPALTAKIPKVLLADLKRKKRKELFSSALFDFEKPTDKCDSCHIDVHNKQFQDRSGGCTGCHQVASFGKLKFDHQKDSKYPLTGKHLKVDCDKCHFVPTDAKEKVEGRLVVRYRPLEQKCSSCHDDPHAGQFAQKGAPADCERCHTTEDFKKVTKFKHEPPFTDFLLDGQHAKQKCEACHQKVKVTPTVQAVRYKPLPQKCEGCHSDFHKGAFQGFEP